MNLRPRRYFNAWVWLALSGTLLVLDQLSQRWVMHHFSLYERQRLLSVLDITLWGSGSHFLLQQLGLRPDLSLLSLALSFAIVGGGILWWMKDLDARSDARLACALAMILGGAAGNLFDRLRMGQVVDIVLAHVNSHYAPPLTWQIWRSQRGRRCSSWMPAVNAKAISPQAPSAHVWQ